MSEFEKALAELAKLQERERVAEFGQGPLWAAMRQGLVPLIGLAMLEVDCLLAESEEGA